MADLLSSAGERQSPDSEPKSQAPSGKTDIELRKGTEAKQVQHLEPEAHKRFITEQHNICDETNSY